MPRRSLQLASLASFLQIMKILHINAGNMYGGVETFLVTLAQQAGDSAEMQSSFAFCFRGRFSEELVASDVPVYSLGGTWTSRFWTVCQARRRLRHILRRSNFDAVVCHMPWNHAVFGPEVKAAGKPLVFWQHGPACGHGWLERWASRTRPDLAISNSRFTARSLPLLFGDIPNQVIYYPVGLPMVRVTDALSLRQRLGLSKDTVVIVQVSRMEEWKGHSLHLRALAHLKDLPNWNCWIVGGAQRQAELEYMNCLKRQAAQLGVADRVQFLGQRTDVSDVLAASDIFCQPNEAPEPFGIVFVEALRAGLPVVTTDIGGGAEIVTEREGRLVPSGDPQALAACLRQLISAPELRRGMGQCGPNRATDLCDPAARISQLQRTLAALIFRSISASVIS
jgi:glycosyltransferase involved in cell wall biosynthesis